MPYLSIASRSTPTPKAKPCHSSGSSAARGDHLRVDHAAAEQFHPAFRSAERAAALFHRPADIDFGRGFGEGEIARAQPQHDIVAPEKGLQERLERPFEMAERNALVDHQPFDLMEHRRVRRVPVGAIDATRRDDADRGLLVHHCADLHGGCVSPEDVKLPLPFRGRGLGRGAGLECRARRLLQRPPLPDPLPASGERERRRRYRASPGLGGSPAC